MRRHRLWAACLVLALASGCATAKAVSRGYTINTPDMTCDEANRYVQQALTGMDLKITEFRKARVGTPGYAAAEGRYDGSVAIACNTDGVRIVPDQRGFSTTREFERGVFLSIIGRGDLVVEREGRYSTGMLHKRQQAQATEESDSANDAEGAPPGDVPAPEGGVEVQLELVRGFATVLDFEANVAAAGILPVKVTILNSTSRSYDFDPAKVVLRRGDSSTVDPLGARKAVDLLRQKAGSGEKAEDGSELGDIQAASGVIPEREIKAARLKPGARAEGYLYFPDGEYARARVTMTDVATGETEAFLVEF